MGAKIMMVFADVVVNPTIEQGTINQIVLVGLAILAVWAISFYVIKAVRSKNVGK